MSFSRRSGMDRSTPCELDGPFAFNAMYSDAMRLYCELEALMPALQPE